MENQSKKSDHYRTDTQTGRGAAGVGAGGAPPEFYILVKDMSLNRGATHFTLELRPCITSSFIL